MCARFAKPPQLAALRLQPRLQVARFSIGNKNYSLVIICWRTAFGLWSKVRHPRLIVRHHAEATYEQRYQNDRS